MTQLVYYLSYLAGGMPGLWVLKVLLLAACGAATMKTIRLYDLGEPWESAALVVWSAGILTHADVRPDLFSISGASLLLLLLEERRLGRGGARARFVAIFFLFALWSNLHAGFVFGLVLIGFYLVGGLAARAEKDPRELAMLLAAGTLGSLCNPYGIGPYRVLADHWAARGVIERAIQEWQPISFKNGFHWPIWPVVAACFALLIKERRRRDLPAGLALATLFFAFSAVRHARLASYFNVTAVPLVFFLGRDFLRGKATRWTFGAGAAVYAAYMAWAVTLVPWTGVFVGKYVPTRAAGFMAHEEEAMSGLRIYNPWEWGGYLGWRLAPWYRVFVDGRYIFHPLLAEMLAAAESDAACQAFMARYRITGALLRNSDTLFPTTKKYPDGHAKQFFRPWYLFYMPRETWALVYWDDQAMLFVDRKSVPKDWLADHEYRYVRPKDDAAFAEAIDRREIPMDVVRREASRHRLEQVLY